MTRKKFVQSAVIGLLILGILGLVLVACGETPTSITSQPLPTSTGQILTLPVPPTSNNNVPTATLSLNGPTGGLNTATAAIFGTTAPTNTDTSVAVSSPLVPTIVPTINTGSVTTATVPTTIETTSPITTVLPFPTTSAEVPPTAITVPPTPPIGISPGLPPTAPIGVSPAVINNNNAITEERFDLDLGDFKAQASIEYPKNGAGPFATILMFQPFGLYDLDATATTSRFGISSRNYKVIADQLALRGFAVVRYTKRGYDASGQSDAPSKDTPIDQLIQDANTAYGQVQAHRLVNPNKIILLGEDEGALVAMHLAQQQPDVAGLILISPITDPKAALQYQTVDAPLAYAREHLDIDKDGILSAQEWANAPTGTYLSSFQNVALDNGRVTNLVSSSGNGSADIERDLKPFLQALFDDGPTSYPTRTDYLTGLFKLGDSTSSLAGFKKPVLILQGELDQQVPLSQGAALDTYLAGQGNFDHNLLKYPKLGHSLYKLDKGGSDVFGPIDVNLPSPNNPINDTLSWLISHFKA